MSRLDDDLTAYLAASTAAERQQALTQWLTDATDILNQAGDRFSQIADALHNLKRLEQRALSRGLIWNPRRLKQLLDEDQAA